MTPDRMFDEIMGKLNVHRLSEQTVLVSGLFDRAQWDKFRMAQKPSAEDLRDCIYEILMNQDPCLQVKGHKIVEIREQTPKGPLRVVLANGQIFMVGIKAVCAK